VLPGRRERRKREALGSSPQAKRGRRVELFAILVALLKGGGFFHPRLDRGSRRGRKFPLRTGEGREVWAPPGRRKEGGPSIFMEREFAQERRKGKAEMVVLDPDKEGTVCR